MDTAYAGTFRDDQLNFKAKFPDLTFVSDGLGLTRGQEILLAKYRIVVDELIREHILNKKEDAIFRKFIDKFAEDIKEKVKAIKDLDEVVTAEVKPATGDKGDEDDEDRFGGAIKKNKHRTSRNRRKIRKSKSKRNKSKRNKSKRNKSKRNKSKRNKSKRFLKY